MSTKGSNRRTLNRDAEKERRNWDDIKSDGKAYGFEVPKDKLPPGVKSRFIYGANHGK